MEATGNRGADSAIKTVSIRQTIKDSIEVIKRGGHINWLALNEDIIDISYIGIVCKSADIKGTFRYKNSYRPVISLLEAGKINFDGWVSHRFKLDDIEDAFRLANDRNADKMKIMITI